MTLAGGTSAVDELAVRRRGPGVGAVAVLLPPVRQTLTGVRQRPLHHLDRRQPTGPTSRGEDTTPRHHAPLLLSWIEEREGWVGGADDRGQRRGVGVVHHHGARLGINPLTKAGAVAREGEGSCGAWLRDAA